MNFLNIGFPELLLVLIIMLIVMGPGKMQEGARNLARLIRKVVRSESWRNFTGIYNEIKSYPQEIMKEVELEETLQELKELNDQTRKEFDEIQREMKAIDLKNEQDQLSSDEEKHESD